VSDSRLPRVLLVDDDANVLSALRRTLRREKIEIETARDAREALAILGDGPVDLVISDHRMPGMSGVELLETIRTRWPKTVRILMSGWSAEIPSAELKAAGLFLVLSKPWDDRELRSAIQRAVGVGVGVGQA
jgi:two-component system NtrC family sensor kinase